ncbi:DUF3347 domain-containing protein [Maribellus mangrovi]|uniref:DUF3347 domain-containing protein n=1 Tax=Maribellus mangrovi TaxID=3133146 RepID=UPI0030EE25FD
MKSKIITICLALISWGAFAQHDHSNMNHNNMMNSNMSDQNKEMSVVNIDNTKAASSIIDNYLALKTALVKDNGDKAASSGGALYDAFDDFNISNQPAEHQKELKNIIVDASEHAEHISENSGDIEHQREHFELLSKDVEDLIVITGADRNMFQIYCPMYNNKEGGMWLSDSREIKNPFYGSKMMKCGNVQKELAVK